MRISINLSEEMLEKVDNEAKRIGITRGSMLSNWIGEKVNSLEQARSMIKDMLNDPIMKEALEKKLRKEQGL